MCVIGQSSGGQHNAITDLSHPFDVWGKRFVQHGREAALPVSPRSGTTYG